MEENQMLNTVLNNIPEVIENPKFELQIQNSENKIIARVAGMYAKSDIQFDELYNEINKKWYKVNALPERKKETMSNWWARNIAVEYLAKQKRKNG